MHVVEADFAKLREACDVIDALGLPYVIGGGTAVVLWGRNRRTKDFDIFLNRQEIRPALDALAHAGFQTADTEKRWLYKAWCGDTLIDFIVESRGGIRIDADTMSHARVVKQYGYDFRMMGPEDTLFRKALTLTEGRPDWYDGLSIIDRQRGQLDWAYFLYLAQRNRRRVLSFLLFVQTELHVPPGAPPLQSDNVLYPGDASGPIPDWVVFTLIQQEWLHARRSPRIPFALTYQPRRAA
ncbi:MAG TPA: nucleotidyltransferase [Armatimonadota bacterium]|jgi:hypothetical protein